MLFHHNSSIACSHHSSATSIARTSIFTWTTIVMVMTLSVSSMMSSCLAFSVRMNKPTPPRLLRVRSPSLIFLFPHTQLQLQCTRNIKNSNHVSSRQLSLWTAAKDTNQNSNTKKKSKDNQDKEESTIQPTWTYTPYKPETKRPNVRRRPPLVTNQRRAFSSAAKEWIVPKSVVVPQDRVELSYVRSSGAGGQNVNKLSTKAELRFHVQTATWMPQEVRDRFAEQHANRISNKGIIHMSCQEHRTQAQNKKDVLAKVQSLVLQAWPRPKERNLRKGISRGAKEQNKDFKRKRAQVKKNRGGVGSGDW